MCHRKKWDVHPFYVKCDWNPPVQPSVAFETYLEEVKSQLAEMKITKLVMQGTRSINRIKAKQ